jgi:hypothetical protein
MVKTAANSLRNGIPMTTSGAEARNFNHRFSGTSGTRALPVYFAMIKKLKPLAVAPFGRVGQIDTKMAGLKPLP